SPDAPVSSAPGPGLVRFSIQELRRLLLNIAWVVRPALDFVLHWSRWRRRHQAIAKRCHYRRRDPRAKVPL
ncbi:MAG TPA: hypothetical protein VFZ09_31325, partial [Archangium sp.]|nr:hypothetical protein [Archangium sp.]